MAENQVYKKKKDLVKESLPQKIQLFRRWLS